MKKIIIATAIVLATGLMASSGKENNIKEIKPVVPQHNFSAMKDLSSAD